MVFGNMSGGSSSSTTREEVLNWPTIRNLIMPKARSVNTKTMIIFCPKSRSVAPFRLANMSFFLQKGLSLPVDTIAVTSVVPRK